MSARYALYFAPRPESLLYRLACPWLGRDLETGETLPFLERVGLSRQLWETITLPAAFYGLHTTLKPPFALAVGVEEEDLVTAVERFTARRPAVAVGELILASLGSFLALTPKRESPELIELAAECVRCFDEFRKPADDLELVRRRAKGLSPRQEELLIRWGYPYVMDQFRFHITLTGPIEDQALKAKLRGKLAAMLATACRLGEVVRDLALFYQPNRETPFVLLGRFPLSGSVKKTGSDL